MKKLTDPITALILSLISFALFTLTALTVAEGTVQTTLLFIFFFGFVALIFAPIYLPALAKKN